MIKCSKQPGRLRRGIKGNCEGDFVAERVRVNKATDPLELIRIGLGVIIRTANGSWCKMREYLGRSRLHRKMG